jgi:hypothetical protein
MNKYYAGIGSRETPLSLLPLIKEIVEILNKKGYTLRSGGAQGADSYFEKYSIKNEIFLPWKDFNGNKSDLYSAPHHLAIEMAKVFHPNYEALSSAAKTLMARNSQQIFGSDMKTPVEFVVCWTKDGKASGGTGQALRIAKEYNIPIYNLKLEKDIQSLMSFLNTQSIF